MPACVLNCFSRVQTVAHQVPLSMGFSRQEYWSGLPFPPPGDLPDPAIESTCPALAGGFFTTSANHASSVPRQLRKGAIAHHPRWDLPSTAGQCRAASAEPPSRLFGGHVLTPPPHGQRGVLCQGGPFPLWGVFFHSPPPLFSSGRPCRTLLLCFSHCWPSRPSSSPSLLCPASGFPRKHTF